MGGAVSSLWTATAEWWWGNLMRTDLAEAERVFILGRGSLAELRAAGEWLGRNSGRRR